MLHDILFFLLGLAFVIVGANLVTDGASAIATRLRVSALVIGVTVVAFGSSAPDLFVCITSTLRHKPELALGDVVGANIFDILAAVGIVSIIRPQNVGSELRTTDIPLLVLSGAALFLCGDDMLFDSGMPNVINRTDGLMLLCFFAIFMTYTLRGARNTSPDPQALAPAAKGNMPKAIAMVLVGLAALALGGNWIVDGSTGMAHRLGLSEGIVGLTIVAFGSAAPDLATTVIAAWKGQSGIALGNIIGACIFNIFFIIGLCATIEPLRSGSITFISYGTLVIGAIMLWLFSAIFTKGRLTRLEGALLLAAYLIYLTYLCTTRLH